jgi:hypothetical protein
MRVRKGGKALLLVICAGVYGYCAVDVNEEAALNVSVDLSAPLSIVWPFEIAVVGDLGEKGLRIGANVGQGWRGEGGGEASYKFYVARDGKYYIWAYCLWFDECANAVFLQMDDLEKAILGNDPIYQEWHWVRGYDVDLEKGTHTLVLSNHSDHIAIQKVFLTNSGESRPETCARVFSDVFYDGFDGCDRGNFADWEVVSGDWRVEDPLQHGGFIENCLVGRCEKDALIIYEAEDWSEYSVSVAVKTEPSEDSASFVGICFCVRSSSEYHILRWRPARPGNRVRMHVCSKNGDIEEDLADFEVRWDGSAWHQLEIAIAGDVISVRVDDSGVFKAAGRDMRGGLGLCLEGRVTAYFDDIHVQQTSEGVL